MSTFPGAVPMDQLNSLPLLSSSQLAYGGVVSVQGGSINRYFSPTDTGIDGITMNAPDPDSSGVGAGDYIAKSNLLDVRGCKAFTCLVAIKLPDANHDTAHTLTLRVMSPAAADVTVTPHSGLCGEGCWPTVGVFGMPTIGAGAYPGYKSAAKGWAVGGRDGGTLQTGSLGYIYLWLSFDNGALDKTAQLYVSLYSTT